MTTWLPTAVELDAYEGIRLGDEDAFRAIAEPLQPALRRLAALYVDAAPTADAVVLHSWEIALRGTDMFCWHTPYATWVAGITAAFGRRIDVRRGAGDDRHVRQASASARPGPPDWADLPWSPRWEQVWTTLGGAVAALPTAEHEVIHGRDVERWPPRRVCDVFGLPEAIYERRLASAHDRLHDAIAALVGDDPPGPHRDARVTAMTRCLARPEPPPEPLDPRALAVFRRWSAARSGVWWRLRHRRAIARVA